MCKERDFFTRDSLSTIRRVKPQKLALFRAEHAQNCEMIILTQTWLLKAR